MGYIIVTDKARLYEPDSAFFKSVVGVKGVPTDLLGNQEIVWDEERGRHYFRTMEGAWTVNVQQSAVVDSKEVAESFAMELVVEYPALMGHLRVLSVMYDVMPEPYRIESETIFVTMLKASP